MEENNAFTIRGHRGDSLTIAYTQVYGFPAETCHWGGYEVRANIIINAGDFSVVSKFYTSTGQIHSLFQQFVSCNESVNGIVSFASYEGNLEFAATYDFGGRIDINGTFRANDQFDNELRFAFASDQTYIQETIKRMIPSIDKYGGNAGIAK